MKHVELKVIGVFIVALLMAVTIAYVIHQRWIQDDYEHPQSRVECKLDPATPNR